MFDTAHIGYCLPIMGTWTLLPFSRALYSINGVFSGIVLHIRLSATITFSGEHSLVQYRHWELVQCSSFEITV